MRQLLRISTITNGNKVAARRSHGLCSCGSFDYALKMTAMRVVFSGVGSVLRLRSGQAYAWTASPCCGCGLWPARASLFGAIRDWCRSQVSDETWDTASDLPI